MFIGFFSLAAFSTRWLIIMKDCEDDKKIKLNPKFLVMSIILIVILIRLCWLIVSWNGRGTSSMFAEGQGWSENTVFFCKVFWESFMLKVGQIGIVRC